VSAGRWPRPHFDAVHPAGGRPKPRASEEGFAFSTGQSAAGCCQVVALKRLIVVGTSTAEQMGSSNGNAQPATPYVQGRLHFDRLRPRKHPESYACHVHTTMELEFMRRVIALFTGSRRFNRWGALLSSLRSGPTQLCCVMERLLFRSGWLSRRLLFCAITIYRTPSPRSPSPR